MHNVAGPARDAAGNHTAAARERRRGRGSRPPQSGCTPMRAACRSIPTIRTRAAAPPLAQGHAPPCGRPRWRRRRRQPRATGRCASSADGNRQWVSSRRAAVHVQQRCKAIGDVAGDGADGGAWHVAAFRPDAGIALPDGIAVREIADAGGAGLVDTSGLTLYAFARQRRASQVRRRRVRAALAAARGACDRQHQWAISRPLARDDGITQWMYRGKPLYKFAADRNPQDVNGSGVDTSVSRRAGPALFHARRRDDPPRRSSWATSLRRAAVRLCTSATA